MKEMMVQAEMHSDHLTPSLFPSRPHFPKPHNCNFQSVCASGYPWQRNNPSSASVADIGTASARVLEGVSDFDLMIEESFNTECVYRPKCGEITEEEAGLMEGVSPSDLFSELRCEKSYAERPRFGEISDAEAGLLDGVREDDLLSERVPDIAPAELTGRSKTGVKLQWSAQSRELSGRAAMGFPLAQPRESMREHEFVKPFKYRCKQTEARGFQPAIQTGSLLIGSELGSSTHLTVGQSKKFRKLKSLDADELDQEEETGSTRQGWKSVGIEPTSGDVEFFYSQKSLAQPLFEYLDYVPTGETESSPHSFKPNTRAWSPTFEKDAGLLKSSSKQKLSKKHVLAKLSTSSS